MYKGVTPLGINRFNALFSATEQFGDGFTRGIQHLFYMDYTKDLIKCAVTINRFDEGFIEYGNVRYDGLYAPQILHPSSEGWEEIFEVYCKLDSSDNMSRKIKAYALEEALIMEEHLENKGENTRQADQFAYAFFPCDELGKLSYDKENDAIIWTNSHPKKNVIIALESKSDYQLMAKEQKGFGFNNIQRIISKEYKMSEGLESNNGLSAALGKKATLLPNNEHVFKWFIIPCNSVEEGISILKKLRGIDQRSAASNIYQAFLQKARINENNEKVKQHYYRNLLALKASSLNGRIPADITGHYFSSDGLPCFYVRDSLMTARAFLAAGYNDEAKKIILFLRKLPMRTPGEFFQRYDTMENPSEGANNYVPHQLDSTGYYLSIICEYYNVAGEWLVPENEIEEILSCVDRYSGYKGLVGPEGGVNEGVYGASFITSTNLFICGGIYKFQGILQDIDKIEGGQLEKITRIRKLLDRIEQGLESMWDCDKEYYCYGYSRITEGVVRRYDTPQYFATIYGYPNTERLVKNNRHLLEYAAFFEDGIGYSQQCYHHGAWSFNTAACAEYNYIADNIEEYRKKISWLVSHSNNYGLMPEAIDADDEKKCYINPLTWACAEFVAAAAISKNR